MILVYSILIGFYAIMMTMLIVGFLISRSKKQNTKKKKQPISVIVPFHNELNNLPLLIASLNSLKYPTEKYEVIFVNDCSTDSSESWLEVNDHTFKFKHVIINLTKKVGKKTAIEKGMILVNFEKVVTTDADCVHDPKWLREINNAKGKLSIGITLKYSNSFGLLAKIQECESFILGGITISSAQLKYPLLASGANLAYDKKNFDKLNPYEDNRQISSGDDMFLLEAMIQNGKSIRTRFKFPVKTKTKSTWSSYINQTTRWSAKTGNLSIPGLSILALITIIGNVTWLATITTWILTKENIFLNLAIIKFTVDFLFLFLTSLTFKRLILIFYAPVMALFYPFYLIVLTIKVLGYKEKWSSNG